TALFAVPVLALRVAPVMEIVVPPPPPPPPLVFRAICVATIWPHELRLVPPESRPSGVPSACSHQALNANNTPAVTAWNTALTSLVPEASNDDPSVLGPNSMHPHGTTPSCDVIVWICATC